MDLRVLEYFLMTAEEGSITHAAELLHVSQPTVSRQLMDLERELGKTLLIRTKKNISLTKDGLLFRETAREILALYQKAVREDASAGELSGELYLGMGETGSVRFLAQEIAAFQKLYPGVHFHLISENADRICEDIEKGLAAMCLNIRGRLSTIPAKLSGELAQMGGDRAGIFDKLKGAIDEALEDLSGYNVALAVKGGADEEEKEPM